MGEFGFVSAAASKLVVSEEDKVKSCQVSSREGENKMAMGVISVAEGGVCVCCLVSRLDEIVVLRCGRQAMAKGVCGESRSSIRKAFGSSFLSAGKFWRGAELKL
jgi:hypothetical protein